MAAPSSSSVPPEVGSIQSDPLPEAAARWNGIRASAIEGIITMHEEGIIGAANAAAQHLFGYSAAEMVGQTVFMLMPEPGGSAPERDGEASGNPGEPAPAGNRRAWVGRRKDGSTFPMELALGESSSKDGRQFTALVRDVSERQKQEAERVGLAGSAEAANKELKRFIRIAAHDLRAPLVNIHGFSKELADGCAHWQALLAEETVPEAVRDKLSAALQTAVLEPLDFILAGVGSLDRLVGGLSRLPCATPPARQQDSGVDGGFAGSAAAPGRSLFPLE